MTPRATVEVPVLIAGAGPTGLVASLLLSRYGVDSLTIERHPGTSIFPRATGINVRTMEIFRSLGFEAEVRAAGFSAVPQLGTSKALIDPGSASSPLLPDEGRDVSPSRWTSCSQFDLEPILLRAAAAHPGARLLFGTELAAFEEISGGICAQVVDRTTGQTTDVRARYLIAADGSRSRVRERMGIEMHGPGQLQQMLNIHFCAPLRQLMSYEPNFLHFVEIGEPAVFAPTDNDWRWMLAVPLVSPGSVSRAEIGEAQAIDLVRRASGFPDLDVHILGTAGWTMQADWAAKMRCGHVFLAGDAAHRMTPAGGHGLNTGVQDAHNLCWKLAAVVQGWAGPRLLDTYEAERMPVGQFNSMHSIALIASAPSPDDRSGLDIDLGFVYESSAVISDQNEPARAPSGGYVQSARPGARAPHLWLDGNSGTSSLDLFGPGYTLLAGAQARELEKVHGIPLVRRKMSGAAWRELYGIDEHGAALVRPDGHVAWRRCGAGGPDLDPQWLKFL